MRQQTTISTIDFLLLLVAVTWGVNATLVKLSLVSGFHPLPFNSARFVLATAVSWVLLLTVQKTLSFRRKDWLGLLLMGLLGHTLYQYVFIEGTNLTTAGNTAILLATIPVHAAWISIWLKTESSRWYIWAGLALSFAGILLVFGSRSGTSLFSAEHLTGNVLVLVAALLFGLYTALSKKWLTQYTPLEFSTYTMTLGTIPMILMSAPASLAQEWSAITPAGWGGMLFSGIFSLALSYFVWNWGVQKIGTSRTAMYNNLPPVFAMATGVMWLGETVTLLQVLGTLFIVAGVLAARFGNRLPFGKKAKSPHS
jgi:drug/metabolite transporter (DMT)-like permease